MKKSKSQALRVDWVNAGFLLTTGLVALTVQPLYLYANGVSRGVVAVFLFYLIATGLSITGGYHRLFSHRSYRASRVVKLFYLIFGSAACQNSALKWSSDHRRHHAYTEQEQDPYNINKGFFWAHMGWVFFIDPGGKPLTNVKDLAKDPLVRWQDRHYVPMAITVGGIIPLLIGFALGDALGCFLLAGVTRTVLVHHATFLINSVCHLWGDRPFSLAETASNNVWVAFLTHGEGYHNFHHQFPYDYRNGHRWYHWDPTKWFIRTLQVFGLTGDLRRARDEQIFKAMVRVQRQLAQQQLSRHPVTVRQAIEDRLHAASESLISLRIRCERLRTEYYSLKKSGDETCHAIAERLRQEIRLARDQFRSAHEAWNLLLQSPLQAYA